jgi:pimeloyl-ACP methyl ester carboxylesterase
MLFYEDLKDVVMAGTSSGGMVLCRTAETARERIARVVFLNALALVDGERIRDIVQRPNEADNSDTKETRGHAAVPPSNYRERILGMRLGIKAYHTPCRSKGNGG